MPSRLVFICPRGTTSAGTERLDELADREAIERQPRRLGVAAGGFDVDIVFEHFQRQPDRLGGLLGQHHRGRAGVDHHRRVDAVDLGVQREFAGLAARDLHRAAQASRCSVRSMCETRVAGARDLFGIAIGDDGAGGRGEHRQHEQDAAHGTPPPMHRSISRAFNRPWDRGAICASPASAMRAASPPSRPAAPRCSIRCQRAISGSVRPQPKQRLGPGIDHADCDARRFFAHRGSSEMVSIACASAPVTVRFRRS